MDHKGETVLFAMATKQMAVSVAAVVASIANRETKPRVVWLVDQRAVNEEWLSSPIAKVLQQHGVSRLEKKTLKGSILTLEEATNIANIFRDASNYVFCAQGGRKFDVIVFETALVQALINKGRPLTITYLENRPIRLRELSLQAGFAVEERARTPACGLSTEQLLACSGHQLRNSDSGQKGGAEFEKMVLQSLQSWLERNSWAQEYVQETGGGIVAERDGKPRAELDAYVLLKDATLLVIECKDIGMNGDLRVVKQNFRSNTQTKDVQSRILMLNQSATTESRLLICFRITDSHVSRQDFNKIWRWNDERFSAMKQPWLAYFDGDQARQWAIRNGKRPFDDMLTRLLAPHCGKAL